MIGTTIVQVLRIFRHQRQMNRLQEQAGIIANLRTAGVNEEMIAHVALLGVHTLEQLREFGKETE
jgi:hypothetical protein